MLARLLALFLITPVIELALLIQLGNWIGFWPTIGIIALTGITGTYLARREGLSVWSRFNDRLSAGDLPGRELLDGVIILVAGALLITPGVITDVVGFIGLIPATRSLIRKRLSARFQRMASERAHQSFAFGLDFAPGSQLEVDDDGTGPQTGAKEEWMGEPRQKPGRR